MSNDSHFEFDDLWETGAIYSLAFAEAYSAQKFI